MTQHFSEDPEAIPGAKIIRKAFIRAYTSGTHKGDVQLVGSHPTLLTDVRFATDIPAAACVTDRECLVIFLDPINQADAIVLSVQGAVPGAATFLSLSDTPAAFVANKGVKVNAGATALELVNTWAGLRHTFSEGVTSSKTVYSNAQDIGFTTGSDVAASGALWVGVKASPTVSGAITVLQGLNFIVRCKRQDAGNVTHLEGCRAGWGIVDAVCAIANANGFVVPTPNHGTFGLHTIATSRGVHVGNVGNSALIAKAIGLHVEDHSTAILSYLLEVGPATPYLRVIGKAAPGGNLTNLYLNEGGNLRRVQSKDGAAIGGGDKVMVLV